MKILVMSLQRIGDIIMTTPVLNALKAKNPQCKIHLLIHSQFRTVTPLIKNVDKVIYFDHKLIQTGLGEADRGIFESYDRIEGLLAELTENNYDMLVNLTHTRLSGWLSSLIPAREKRGLVMDPSGSAKFGSRWFEYLNQTGSRQNEEAFHFIDIFFYGVGLRGHNRKIVLNETETGKAEAELHCAALGPYICVQPLTSDEKKDWGVENWVQALAFLSDIKKSSTFVILGAPNEEAQLKVLSQKLNKHKVRHKICICSLEGAYSILLNCDLLITGDTSIKHMAAATAKPILELSIGSSSYQRTGAYSDKAVILQSIESCAPCTHSKACPYSEHKCAVRISPEGVALVAHAMLTKNEIELRTVAQEFSDEYDLLRTEYSSDGDWNAYRLSERFSKNAIIKWIDRSSQRLFFNNYSEADMIAFGSEGVYLSRLLNSIFPDREKFTWVEVYKELEVDCNNFASELEMLMTELKSVIRDFDNADKFERFKSRLESICNNTKHSDLFRSYLLSLSDALNESLKNESRFLAIKRMREILTMALQRCHIEAKIVRSLKNQTLEGL